MPHPPRWTVPGFRQRPCRRVFAGFIALAATAFTPVPSSAQTPAESPAQATRGSLAASSLTDADLQAATFRLVGPFRGGRVTTVDGIPDQPHTFFFGSTGGGVWKTESAGQGWENLTD